jgi:ArsR family transcriptional regulator
VGKSITLRVVILAVFPSPVVHNDNPGTMQSWDQEQILTMTDALLISRDEDIAQAANSIKAMAHPLRLKILCLLGDGESSVQELVDACGTTQSNISQHLAVLREKDILDCRKESNRVYYYVDDKRTLKLITLMREVFCHDPDSTSTPHH